MPDENWIEIAREGTFTDSAGREQTFTAKDLADIASAYDPQKRDCPLVFGHPQTDSAPAYGWARELVARGGKLLAAFERVPEEVKNIVRAGHYRHVSMSLMPDRKTLRHVALLGAVQPAIDGLAAVEMTSADNSITVEFATPKEGAAMPENDLQREIGALKERIKALETENASLKQQAQSHKEGKEKAESAKTEAEAKAEKAAADFAAYKGQIENERREVRVSALVEAGKVTPAEKAGVLQFAAALAELEGKAVNFAAQGSAAAPQGSKPDFTSGAAQGCAPQDAEPGRISLVERYLRELEARPVDGRFADFSAPPEHAIKAGNARVEDHDYNPAEITAKL